MNDLIVAKVNTNQIEALQEISRSTFYETFAAFNSDSDMQNYLEKDMSIHQLTNEFKNPDSLFYFASTNDKVIGYLKLNFINLEDFNANKKGIEIARIYVRKEFHGSRAGQNLFNVAMTIALESNCNYIWLGVWENNPRAIRFYEKNGFEIKGNKKFVLGDDVQNDFIMVRSI
jgi:ribosomal protein S18 acetylase RimI-like enzyme